MNIGAVVTGNLIASGIGNTVDYNGSGAQTVLNVAYYNLTLGGTGTVGIPSSTSVAGTLTVAGTVTANLNASLMVGGFAQTSGTFIDNGFTLTISGTGASAWSTTGGTTTLTGTANFTGTAPLITGPVTFKNLTINLPAGGDTASLAGGISVSGTLTVTPGHSVDWLDNLTVTGTSNITGTLSLSGAGTFVLGNITVNSGGTFQNTANAAVAVNGNIANSGTFSAGTGTYTLQGSGATIGGSNTVSIPTVVVSGSYTNSVGAIFTVGTALNGGVSSGSLVNNGTLNIGGTIGNLNSITLTPSGAGNTVNYNGAGNQSVYATTYVNLQPARRASRRSAPWARR